MTILALEFSSAKRSVAVLGPGAEPVTAASATPERNTRAFALIDEALRRANKVRANVECIAVGLGPGSYTGIRVAISIAQGWQLGRGVKLLGISSVDTIASQARADGMKGRIVCAVDAQRGEFYVATYDLADDPPAVVEPLHIESRARVRERASGKEVIVGPEETLPGNRLVFPDAGVLAKLAMRRTDFVSGEKLEPIYLRETAFVKVTAPRLFPTE